MELTVRTGTTPSKRDLGQVIEWQVWSALIGYSQRITHVFLPLDDRGVDGIVRRLDDDAMCAIQVKGRTSLFKGELQVVLRDVAIADTHLTVVVALLEPQTMALARTVYVFGVAAVNRLGTHSTDHGHPIVELAIPFAHPQGTRWEGHACPIEQLVDRVLPALAPEHAHAAPLQAIPPGAKDVVGQLAELEVMRLLGDGTELNTFKSFPDIEVAEYLVRHRPSGRIRGVQVKVITLHDPNGHGMVNFHRRAFRPSPAVDVVVLTYRADLAAFDDHAWVIPAADIPALVSTEGRNIELMLHPAGGYGSKYDRYRIARRGLAAHLTEWFRAAVPTWDDITVRRMPTPDVTALIEAAIRDHLVLTVTYRPLDGTVGAIEAEPLAIRLNRAGHRVLWCRKRDLGHLEELLWDGIEAAVATGEVFEPVPWVEGG